MLLSPPCISPCSASQPDAWRAFVQCPEPDLFDRLSDLSDALSQQQRAAGGGAASSPSSHPLAGVVEASGPSSHPRDLLSRGSFLLLLLVKVLSEDKLLAAVQR